MVLQESKLEVTRKWSRSCAVLTLKKGIAVYVLAIVCSVLSLSFPF